MTTDLPEPYDRIRLLVGRRTMPDDWPSIHDEWDAYGPDGDFLMTLGIRAVNQLLSDPSVPRTEVIAVESADEMFLPITVMPGSTLDLRQEIRFPMGPGHPDVVIRDPDRLPTRATVAASVEAMFRDP